MNITGGIDGEIVSFVFMVFAEEFTVKSFEEIVFIKSTETKISQTDGHMDRRTIRFREECHELEMKFITGHHLPSVKSKLTAVRLSIKGLLHTST